MSACTICDENINERSKTNGDDAVFCDGKCQSWLHRHCAGLSRVRFRIVTDSKGAFYCPQCQIETNATVISSLKSSIESLKKEIETMKAQSPTNTTPKTYATATAQSTKPSNSWQNPSLSNNTPQTTTSNSLSAPNVIDKKFNLVIYRIPESSKGTNRNARFEHDLSQCTTTVKKISNEVSTDPIRDCTRLGRYSEGKRRPILLRFARALDVSKILANS